jgi:RNA polymerase sigma factor (sigma-70 family)
VTNDEIDALDSRLLAEGRLDEVLARHLPDLRARARVRIRDEALADDVVQQALERVLRELRRGKHYRHPMRVVLHQVLGWAIGDAFARRREREPDAPLDAWAGGDDDGYGAVDARDWFDRAAAALPDRDRVVMRMRFAEGREAREIAVALGITANAVHQAIHRGRRALRAAWTG